MARSIGDHINMNVPLYEDFETKNPKWEPMQGRSDTDFHITLSKDGEVFDIPADCTVTAKFYCYEEGQTELKMWYEIAPTNPDGSPNANYNISIVNNAIIIPANVAMTDFAGDIKMTVIVTCPSGGISIPYVYRYTVTALPGYKMSGGNVNLVEKANVTFDNVKDATFLAKAAASGILPGAGATSFIY